MFDDEDSDMYDEETEENEISADPAPPAQSNVRPIRQIPLANKKKRQLRVRPMTPAMAEKHPEVVSIIMTRADGRQLMFVR